jgi:hypothetical protein
VVRGAATSIYAAAAPELAGKGCAWLDKSTVATLGNKIAHDPEAQAALWEFSLKCAKEPFTL